MVTSRATYTGCVRQRPSARSCHAEYSPEQTGAHMKPDTANRLALYLASNANNVADLVTVRVDGTYDRGW